MGLHVLKEEMVRLVILEKEIETRLNSLSEEEKAVSSLSSELMTVRNEVERIKNKIYQASMTRFEKSVSPLEESLEKLVGKSQEQIRIDKKFEDLEMEEELARLKKGKSHGSAGSLKNPKSLPLS